MYRQTGPSRGNRLPTIAAPGSSGRSRPTRQRGGGGNKAAGSPEPTAANTPSVTVDSSGRLVESRSPALAGDGAERWTAAEVARVRASVARTRRIKREVSREERQRRAAAVASVGTSQGRRRSESGKPASVARISSVKAGPVATPKPAVSQQERRAARADIRQAKKAVRRSAPDLSGLSPAERRAAKLDVRIGPKFGIPPSVLMSQQRQESGFDPAAVSSADAQGISQFIPSTAAEYGVEFGTGQKEVRSQIRGQAKLLRDKGFTTDPKAALSAYSGGYSDAEYNDPVLEGAADYKGLDRRGNPKARRQLAAARAAGKQLGLKVAEPDRRVGPAPKKLVKRTVVAEHAMREIEGQPYIWGGGHGSFTEYGKDCSGAVSYVLHKVMPGRMKTPLTSSAMGQVLEPGPGALTVFYNSEHTFLRLINRKGEAEYWGTSVGDSGAGGLTRHSTPSKSYLAQYNVGHVPGMGKLQALQLGADPAAVSGGGSYAGMSFGSSGSTATIDPGAAVVKSGKPGRSKKPIQLTPLQRYDRAKRKLRSVGAPISATSSASSRSGRSESHPILEELKAKYGSAPTSAKQKAAEAAAA